MAFVVQAIRGALTGVYDTGAVSNTVTAVGPIDDFLLGLAQAGRARQANKALGEGPVHDPTISGGGGGGGGGGKSFFRSKNGQPIRIDAGGESGGKDGRVDLNPYNGSELKTLSAPEIQQRIANGTLVQGGIEELAVHFAPNSVAEIHSQQLPSPVLGRHTGAIIKGVATVLQPGGTARIHSNTGMAPDIAKQYTDAGWQVDASRRQATFTKP